MCVRVSLVYLIFLLVSTTIFTAGDVEGASKEVTAVIVDDDFVDSIAVVNYNTENGTSYIWGLDAFSDIQEGIDAVDSLLGGNIYVLEGLYGGRLNMEERNNLTVLGDSQTGTIFKPDAAYNWDVGTYGSSRQTAIRVVNSANIQFSNMTMDFDLIRGNNISGILYWNSEGTISENVIKNMNFPDAAGGYYEITSYFRAPDFTAEERAQVEISNNQFFKTGRVGIVAHDYVNVLIEGNSFDKVEEDFGYGIELGSTATGIIRRNTFQKYARWAASDNSTVAAIYVENSFTYEITEPVEKPVVIDSNNIINCQFGIYAGNEHDAPSVASGNVDIVMDVKNNSIYDAITMPPTSWPSGGMVITDEGRDKGSSVTATVDSNEIINNDDYGIYLYTAGNGDIDATIKNNIITDQIVGIRTAEFPGYKSGSIYLLMVYHNILDNNANAYDDIIGGFWDDGISVGNCWMDFQNNSGYPEAYNIIGNAGAIDRFPNVDCGSLCDCITGNANGDETINIFDIAYIINYLYVEGPSPIPYETCSADPNCDCLTNIFDVTYLINFLYREGSAPCSCNNWVSNCTWPPDKGAAGNSLNLRDINTDLDRQIDDAIPYR